MKQINLTIIIFAAAAFLAACGAAPNENKPAASNTITNTASKPVAGLPTKELLMANENQAWESWKGKNPKYFEDYLTENVIAMGSKGRSGKAAVIERISDPTCDVLNFSLIGEQLTPLGADAALLTYKATQEAKCGGKALPLAVWAATVVVRSGDKWKAAYHNEVPITDPKTAPANPADKKEVSEKAKHDPAKSDAPDANTDAMLAVEKAVWEAWKNHDGQKINDLTAKDISFINIFGTFLPNKAAAIKDWTATGCEVTSVSVTDAEGTMLSPNVGILTFKGGADGTCFGQKVPPIWGTSIYVKDGDAWKWAFGMNISAD